MAHAECTTGLGTVRVTVALPYEEKQIIMPGDSDQPRIPAPRKLADWTKPIITGGWVPLRVPCQGCPKYHPADVIPDTLVAELDLESQKVVRCFSTA